MCLLEGTPSPAVTTESKCLCVSNFDLDIKTHVCLLFDLPLYVVNSL